MVRRGMHVMKPEWCRRTNSDFLCKGGEGERTAGQVQGERPGSRDG